MSKFKIGDVIRCTKDSFLGSYKEGKTYEVAKCFENTVWTTLDEYGATNNGWYPDDFELAGESTEAATHPKYFMIVQTEYGDEEISYFGTLEEAQSDGSYGSQVAIYEVSRVLIKEINWRSLDV